MIPWFKKYDSGGEIDRSRGRKWHTLDMILFCADPLAGEAFCVWCLWSTRDGLLIDASGQ
jgi:hypothetical protein